MPHQSEWTSNVLHCIKVYVFIWTITVFYMFFCAYICRCELNSPCLKRQYIHWTLLLFMHEHHEICRPAGVRFVSISIFSFHNLQRRIHYTTSIAIYTCLYQFNAFVIVYFLDTWYLQSWNHPQISIVSDCLEMVFHASARPEAPAPAEGETGEDQGEATLTMSKSMTGAGLFL